MMRIGTRWLAVIALVAFASGVGWQMTSTGVSAQGRVITIHDNDAPSPAPPLNLFDPRQAQWRFNPDHIEVRQGEPIVIRSQPNNQHPHTVTNLVRTSGPFPDPVTLQAGTQALPIGGFDTSPTADRVIQPGETRTLETTGLRPGVYAYICKLHPWMSGVITVTQ